MSKVTSMINSWDDVRRVEANPREFVREDNESLPTIESSAYFSMLLDTLCRLKRSRLTVENQEVLRELFLRSDGLAMLVIDESIGS